MSNDAKCRVHQGRIWFGTHQIQVPMKRITNFEKLIELIYELCQEDWFSRSHLVSLIEEWENEKGWEISKLGEMDIGDASCITSDEDFLRMIKFSGWPIGAIRESFDRYQRDPK